MNKKDPSTVSKGLSNASSLTANIEVLEAESNIKSNKSEKLIERSKSSRRYNEDDLKEHTRIVMDLKKSLSGALSNIKEYTSITDGFLDRSEGIWLIIVSFLGMCISPIIFKENLLIYLFVISVFVFGISVTVKVLSFKKRKKRKVQILSEFRANRRKIKYMLNRTNQVQTYIALSHNSVYRRTFNANLYKLLRDELEKNARDELKINYRVWQEALNEIERGQNQQNR